MSLNILVVDDSSTVRSMVARTLELARVPVGELHEAADGREALDILRSRWIDLAFVDVHMPVLAGHEMVERMRRDPVLESVPVVLLTSEGSTVRTERLKAQGVRAHLRKPCRPESIREVVGALFEADPTAEDDASLVGRVVAGVFQDLVYLVAEPLPAEQAEPGDGPHLRGVVSFRGRARGTLTVVAPVDLAREAAGNLLGDDDGPDARAAEDAFAELVGVSCGHLITELVGEGPALEVGIPDVRPVGPAELRDLLASGGAAALDVEGRLAGASLRRGEAAGTA